MRTYPVTGHLRLCLAGMLTAMLALVPATAGAIPVSFLFDTSALNPLAGIYSLDFQLTSSEAPTTNSATISTLQLGGGGLLGGQFYAPTGGYGGDLSATMTLSATDFFNSVTRDFTPGSFVAFDVDVTNVAPSGLIPDQFSFAILLDGIELPSADPFGTNRLLRYDLTGSSAAAAERFDLRPAHVPEPATLILLGPAVAVGALVRRRRGGSR